MPFRTVKEVIVDFPTSNQTIPRSGSLDVTAHYTLNDDGDTDPTCNMSWTETSPHNIGWDSEAPATAGVLYTKTFQSPQTDVPGPYVLQIYVQDADNGTDHYSATFGVTVEKYKEEVADPTTFHGAESALDDVG